MYNPHRNVLPLSHVQMTQSRLINSPSQLYNPQYLSANNSRTNSRNLSYLNQPDINLSRYQNAPKNEGHEYGREREKLAQYVMEQFSKDQQNKKILEKFRLDAIKRRNNQSLNKKGALPYLTESMVPGASIDPNQFKQKQIHRPINYYQPQRPPLQPQPLYRPNPQFYTVVPSPIASPKKSVGVQVNFEDEFPLKKKKRKRYYTIQDYKQFKAFHKIDSMLHEINDKLQYNTQTLKLSLINSLPKTTKNGKKKGNQRKPSSFQYRRYFTECQEQQTRPTIEYSTQKLREKPDTKKKQTIKDHLKLLKRNKKRLQDLDQYVYQY